MSIDAGNPLKCALCGSLEHEHIRSGESCTDRLVKQRNLAQVIAACIAVFALGMIVTYTSVVLLFLR